MLLEASGGITLDDIEEYAASGVDVISLGALTRNARWIDLSLEIEQDSNLENAKRCQEVLMIRYKTVSDMRRMIYLTILILLIQSAYAVDSNDDEVTYNDFHSQHWRAHRHRRLPRRAH